MGAGAMGAIGAAGGFMSALEARSQGRRWNRMVSDAALHMAPQYVMQSAYQYNPFLWAALGIPMPNMPRYTTGGGWNNAPNPYDNGGMRGFGQYADTPYSKSLANLINNPGYIDPAMMNNSLTMIDRGSAAGLSRAQGMIGRSGMEGGLGAAYALANQAGNTNQKSNLMQQYILFREQQRRSDIGMINEMIQQSISTASRNQEARANILLNKKPALGWAGVGANTIKGMMEGMSLGMQGSQSMNPSSLTGGYQGRPAPSSWGEGNTTFQGNAANGTNDITPENNPLGQWGTANATMGTQTGGNGGGGLFGAASNGGSLATPTSAPTVWGNYNQPRF